MMETAIAWFTQGTEITTTPDSANQESGRYCMKCVQTANAGPSYIHQSWEFPDLVAVLSIPNKQNLSLLIGQTVTFTARVKTASANVRIGINCWNTGVGNNFTWSTNAATNNIYQTLSVTATITANTRLFQLMLNANGAATYYVDSVMLVIGPYSQEWTPGPIVDRVQNAQLAGDIPRVNMLSNGGFELWRNGTSGLGANAYNADKWYGQLFGGAATFNGTIARSTTVDPNGRSLYSWTANVTANATEWCRVYQILTDYGQVVGGAALTFSMRIRVSVANAARIWLYADTNNGSGGSSVQAFSAYHSGSGNWETLTASIIAPAGTNYLMVAFYFYATCTPYVDNGMLVLGSVPADYYPLSMADERVRCADTAWFTLPYSNGWADWGGVWDGAQCFLGPDGIVHVRGLLKSPASPASSQAVVVFPVIYRPKNNHYLAGAANGTINTTWYINAADGSLNIVGYNGTSTIPAAGYFSIAGMSWPNF